MQGQKEKLEREKGNEEKQGKSGKRKKVEEIALIGVMTAVLCLLGPWSIPIGIVPISLGTLAVSFVVYVLGMRRGVICVAVYLLLGAAGVPVFTGFAGGIGKVLGPTGGYLVGYLFLALFAGLAVDLFPKKPVVHFIGLLSGILVCYLVGTLWITFQQHMGFHAAWMAYALPFLPFDLVKILIALAVGSQVRKQVIKTGFPIEA